MVTLCCALMVHVRARPVDLGNLVFDAPNRLDVTDLLVHAALWSSPEELDNWERSAPT